MFETMVESISKLIDTARNAMPSVPALLLELGTVTRPGISAKDIAGKIIARQIEAGAPYGPAADGTQNIAEAMERIRVEEIVEALKISGKIQIGIPIGGIQFIGTGTNEGGPMVVTGFNTNFVKGNGILG